MRYFVQLMTLSDATRAEAAAAVDEGLLIQPDRTVGYVQGEAEDTAIETLRERGLPVRVLSPITEPRHRMGREGWYKVPLGLEPARRPSSPAARYVLSLNGSLTELVRARLAHLGVSFLERLPRGDWAVRVDGDRDLNDIERDPIVQSIEAPPAPALVDRGPSDEAPGEIVDYEALLFSDADSDEVAGLLMERGAEIHYIGRDVLRFSISQGDLDRVREIGGISSVEPIGAPSVFNDMARPLIGVPEPLRRRAAGEAGEGEIVGVADTGLDVRHPDFAGRIVKVETLGRYADGSDPHGHGTHVTGTIAGSGEASDGLLAGVAPGAEIYFQSLLDSDGELSGLPVEVADLMAQAYAAGVRVHNNSWGVFLRARYASASLSIDRFVYENPDFLAIVAAGNNGSSGVRRNSAQGYVDYPSLATPASAKNVLTVGASRSSRTKLGFAGMTYGQTWPRHFPDDPISSQTVSGDPDCLAGFSSRGPSDDRRIKPDVVAPGTDVASAKSADAPLRNFWGSYPNNPHYALMGGTSMACPLVTGLAVLIRQYLRRKRDHDLPSAALLRAIIINGARRISGDDATAPPGGDPNIHQGFGRVRLETSIPCEENGGLKLGFVDSLSQPTLDFRLTGEMRQFVIDLETPGELRLCLAWTDLPMRSIQNALTLLVELPDGSIRASNLQIEREMGLSTPAPRDFGDLSYDRDPDNNAQAIAIENAVAGRYVVSVLADNLLFPPQGFALVATGPVASLTHMES